MLGKLRQAMEGRAVKISKPSAPESGVRTIEVWDADVDAQRRLLQNLRPIRDDLKKFFGGNFTVIFHKDAKK